VIASSYRFKSLVLAICNQEDFPLAGLPVFETRRLDGKKKWTALAFSDHCEILATDQRAKMELVNSLDHQMLDQGIDKIEIRCELPETSWEGASSNYVIHKLRLEEDLEVVHSRMHPMHRRNIGKALNYKMEVKTGFSLEFMREFYKLHLDTRHRLGVPIQPWQFFKNLSEQVIGNGLGFILLVEDECESVAGGVFLQWGDTLTYKFGASLTKARKIRANNLMMWSAIKWGCGNGYKMMDMGRTNLENSGLRSYKSNWGAHEFPLVYTSSSDLTPGTKGGGIMRFAESLIRRSPRWVCKLSGEMFYRYFA